MMMNMKHFLDKNLLYKIFKPRNAKDATRIYVTYLEGLAELIDVYNKKYYEFARERVGGEGLVELNDYLAQVTKELKDQDVFTYYIKKVAENMPEDLMLQSASVESATAQGQSVSVNSASVQSGEIALGGDNELNKNVIDEDNLADSNSLEDEKTISAPESESKQRDDQKENFDYADQIQVRTHINDKVSSVANDIYDDLVSAESDEDVETEKKDQATEQGEAQLRPKKQSQTEEQSQIEEQSPQETQVQSGNQTQAQGEKSRPVTEPHGQAKEQTLQHDQSENQIKNQSQPADQQGNSSVNPQDVKPVDVYPPQ
jgi:hypothetical protein